MSKGAKGDLISFFVRHPVAGNLLMLGLFLFGLYGASQLERQVTPTLFFNVVSVMVEWPGASAADVESSIIQGIEPEVRFLDGIDYITSTAYEGRGELTINFLEGADKSKALSDVQSAVARVTTLPQEAEKPVVMINRLNERVCRIQLSGPFSERSLRIFAMRMRDELLAAGIPDIEIAGARQSEIWVEIPNATLLELDLTLDEIAARIDDASLDLPGGTVDRGGQARQVRSEELAKSTAELGRIEVIAEDAGVNLLLRDVANLKEVYEENSVTHLRKGKPSVQLFVMRSAATDSIQAQEIVENFIADAENSYPTSLNIEMHDVYASLVSIRIDSMTKNATIGFLLVILILYLFLNVRVAFWVAAGIPIVIAPTLAVFGMLDVSLDAISLFAILLGLGIIVDDAIVVGDLADVQFRRGNPPVEAAELAAHRMFAPVCAASLTTVAAFAPVLSIGGTVGAITEPIPVAIIAIVTFSMIECFLILPSHLRQSFQREGIYKLVPNRPGDKYLQTFKERYFAPFTAACYRNRYATLLAALCILWLSVFLITNGIVRIQFYASPSSNLMFSKFALTPGMPRSQTQAMIFELERSAREVELELGGGANSLISFGLGVIGTNKVGDLPGDYDMSSNKGDHLGAYTLELIDADLRSIDTNDFIRIWLEKIQPVAGLEQLSIVPDEPATPGSDVEIQLYGADIETLKTAALELQTMLRGIPGLSGIQDDMPFGKQELILEPNIVGKNMGMSANEIARQVRDSFSGAIAKRFSRDAEEVIVKVKLSDTPDASGNLSDIYLRTPEGSEVPLTEVATINQRIGFSQIRRKDGQQQISITANTDEAVTTFGEARQIIDNDILPVIVSRYNVSVDVGRRARLQAKAFTDIQIAGTVGLIAIYLTLAWVLSSYALPLLVMSIIPFGIVGAVVGHWVMGFNLSYLGLIGVIGLAGIVVNDSIIIMLRIREMLTNGMTLEKAAIEGSLARMRPVLLTSITTIGGLSPILLERGINSEFDKPLAITISFGLAFSTFLVLILVPCLLGICQDVKQKFGSGELTMLSKSDTTGNSRAGKVNR